MRTKTLSLFGLLLLTCSVPVLAVDHVVTVKDFSFSPKTLTINTGDTVTFKNSGGFHNAHADDDSFMCADSCSNGAPASDNWSSTVTFSKAGTVTYHCDIHQSMGMVGSITVQGAAATPDFSLSPASASVSLVQGGTANDAINLTPANGFTGTVSYTASGLPTGVTANFVANGSAGTNLVLSATPSAAVGDSTVTVTGSSGSLTHSTTFALAVTAAASSFSISPAITGLWFNDTQSGQGFDIQVLDGTNIAAIWYVFDTNGVPLWLIAVGTYSGNTATLNVTETTGGDFPPNFDQTKIVRTAWGTFNMTFTDCNSGTVAWTPTVPNFTSGSISIQRLTGISGLTCQ